MAFPVAFASSSAAAGTAPLTTLDSHSMEHVCAFLRGREISHLSLSCPALHRLLHRPRAFHTAAIGEHGPLGFPTHLCAHTPALDGEALYRMNTEALRPRSVEWRAANVVERPAYSVLDGQRGEPDDGAGDALSPGDREGSSMCAFGSMDMAAVVGGWCAEWPVMRRDVWVLDCNPLQEADVAQLRDIARVRAVDGVPHLDLSDAVSAGVATTVVAGGQQVDVTPAAEALLRLHSPSATGTHVRTEALQWHCSNMVRAAGVARPPRRRYGHVVLSLHIDDEHFRSAVARATQPPHAAAAAASASSSSSSPPPMRSPSHMLRRGASADAVTAPEWINETILMTGGMFSGGYTNETNEMWLLRVKRRVVAVPRASRAAASTTFGAAEAASSTEASSESDVSRVRASVKRPADEELVDDASARKRVHAASDASPSVTSAAAPTTYDIQSLYEHEWCPVTLRSAAGAVRARGYHAACFAPATGHVYVAGGISDGDSIWALEALDVAAWTCAPVRTTGRSPSPRHGHSMTVLGDRLWVYSGSDGGDILREGEDMHDLHCLDLKTMTWSTTELSPVPRWGGRLHSCIGLETSLLVFGGGVEAMSNRVGLIDTRSGKMQSPTVRGRRAAPSPRYNQCSARVGRQVVFYGGWAEGSPLGDVTVLHLAPLSDPYDAQRRQSVAAAAAAVTTGASGHDEEEEEDGAAEEEDARPRTRAFMQRRVVRMMGGEGLVVGGGLMAMLQQLLWAQQGMRAGEEEEEEMGDDDGAGDGDDDAGDDE